MTRLPAPRFIDAYAVLDVDPRATQGELKQAHRRLVRTHHPDLAPPERRAQATRRTQEINVAYGLVRTPQARARYDRLRARVARTPGSNLDRAAAARWDDLSVNAGRWAGRWWLANRGRVRRAGVRAGAAGLGVVGRLRWLASAFLWTLAGLVAAVFAQDAGSVTGPATLLVGGLGGLVVGHRRGLRARLRTLGAGAPRVRPASTVALLVVAAAALAAGVWADARLHALLGAGS